MDINAFLNPVEETVQNTLEDVDHQILAQYMPDNEMDADSEEELEILPQVSIDEAIAAIQRLRLYEEQQVIANMDLLQVLKHHEKLLLQKQTESQRVSDARAFF